MSRTKIVGIVNVTPDSFSDGGIALDATAAITRINALLNTGADVIDIGAESTRPGAVALTWEEEWQRLAPVLAALHGDISAIRISIDTYHPETAVRALDAGVVMINDVGGLRSPEMRRLLAQHDCDIISMHALSLPVNSAETLAEDTDMALFFNDWAAQQYAVCEEAGIATARLTLDPGLGFGKTPAQSAAALRAVIQRDHSQESWLIGHSRKSFLKLVSSEDGTRDDITRTLSAVLMHAGVAYIRVHDVAGHVVLREVIA